MVAILDQQKQQVLEGSIIEYEQCINSLTSWIVDTSKQLDQATLQGKFNKLIESKVIPRAAFLLDVLKEAFLLDVLTEAFLLDVLKFVYKLSGCRFMSCCSH